jgi:PEP-CTERM/exosortase A-associated glycosyltransferase
MSYIRILHILDHSVPLHSGYSFRTLAILREQRQLGWETFHITGPKQTGWKDVEENVEGLSFFRTRPVRGMSARFPVLREVVMMKALTKRLDEVVSSVRPHILHAHSPVLNAMPALHVGRRRGIPVVYEVRAFWEDAAVDHGTNREWGLRYRTTRALETWVLKHVDAITTICQGLRNDILSRGIPTEKITIIPNAVDVNRFSIRDQAKSSLRKMFNFDGKQVLGFIGSFYAYEGLALLLKAFSLVIKKRQDVRVCLVGGGPDESHLRETAHKLDIREKVIFTGRIPHGKVISYYDLIDVFVYPRLSMRLTETVTPLKPLEAMARGALVIASDVGGHKELIRDGYNGFLFRAGDPDALAEKLVDILDKKESWPSVQKTARRFAENERNWTTSVKLYHQVYAFLRQK